MHPAGRICKLSPMTILTSASHVKVTPRIAILKKSLDAAAAAAAGSHHTAHPVPRSSIKLN